MKKIILVSFRKIALVFMLFLSVSLFAQPGFDDGTDIDEPVAPINDWILAVAGLGVVYALYQVKKNTVKQ